MREDVLIVLRWDKDPPGPMGSDLALTLVWELKRSGFCGPPIRPDLSLFRNMAREKVSKRGNILFHASLFQSIHIVVPLLG